MTKKSYKNSSSKRSPYYDEDQLDHKFNKYRKDSWKKYGKNLLKNYEYNKS